MEQIIRIGMDTSKSVFQLHGVNAKEQPVLRRKLSGNPPIFSGALNENSGSCF